MAMHLHKQRHLAYTSLVGCAVQDREHANCFAAIVLDYSMFKVLAVLQLLKWPKIMENLFADVSSRRTR